MFPEMYPWLLNLEEMSEVPARTVLRFMEMHTQALVNMALPSGSERTLEESLL